MPGEMLNITGYKFVSLDALERLQSMLKDKCVELGLKGTILLSEEGINQYLAGTVENIQAYTAFITNMPAFADLSFKYSYSENQPFERMLVKLKKETITMGMPEIKPSEFTAPHLSPKEFKQWLDQGKDVVILDTRNSFEYEIGSFDGAIHLNINEFSSFPEALQQLPGHLKDKPVVIFCTGGIRCEKAGPVMMNKGFNHVYQLDGGILKYFEECGGDYYHGNCFVFDHREALNTNLEPIDKPKSSTKSYE